MRSFGMRLSTPTRTRAVTNDGAISGAERALCPEVSALRPELTTLCPELEALCPELPPLRIDRQTTFVSPLLPGLNFAAYSQAI